MTPAEIVRRAQMVTNALLAPIDLEIQRRRGIGRNLMSDVQRVCPRPSVIIDVGANTGQTYLAFRRLYPSATIHSFEPTQDCFEQLQRKMRNDPQAEAHPFAIGDTVAEREFIQYPVSTANSFLKPTEAASYPSWVKEQRSVQVKQTTIDRFCRDHPVHRIDILKTDTQGYDGRVLQGAIETLETVSVVLCEILFETTYQSQSNLDDIYRFLCDRGFRLIGFYDPVRGQDGLSISYANALFLAKRD